MCVVFVCGQVFNHGAMRRYDLRVNIVFQIQIKVEAKLQENEIVVELKWIPCLMGSHIMLADILLLAHNFPPLRPTGLARIQWKIVSAGIICDTIFWGVCFFCCCFILEFVHFRLYYVVRPSCYFPRNLAESMCMCFVHFQVNKMFSAGKNSIWELFS